MLPTYGILGVLDLITKLVNFLLVLGLGLLKGLLNILSRRLRVFQQSRSATGRMRQFYPHKCLPSPNPPAWPRQTQRHYP